MAPRVPGALVIVVLGAASVALGLVTTSTIGTVPSGLPAFHIPAVQAADVRALFPVAATLALVAFMEAFSVAKSIAQKTRDHDVDADQELRALGMANAVGSLFGAYPTSGGFSRTAVNHRSGARTGVSALIAATTVALTLLFLTDLFHFLPKASLGAIIAVAVVSLFDLAYFRTLWRTHRDEAMLMLATFLITAFGGMVMGIAAGVALSLTLTLYRTSRPHTAELGAIGGVYRNLNCFPRPPRRPANSPSARWPPQLRQPVPLQGPPPATARHPPTRRGPHSPCRAQCQVHSPPRRLRLRHARRPARRLRIEGHRLHWSARSALCGMSFSGLD